MKLRRRLKKRFGHQHYFVKASLKPVWVCDADPDCREMRDRYGLPVPSYPKKTADGR